MEPKRPSIPLQIESFRRPRRWRRWIWVLAAGLLAVSLVWLAIKSPGRPTPQPAVPAGTTQEVRPPWQMGNPEGRFTLTLYADLECPFCREYFPQLKRWVGNNTDVALQWHHQPLAAHEPAASAE
ncbi:MAG: DsbA family protein, partial [Burkholderiaceae bacterium]